MPVVTMVIAPFGPTIVAVFLASRRNMSETVGAETVIADGQTHSPIGMETFPIVETCDAKWFANQPDVAGPEVKAGIADKAHIFNAVPDVIIRNSYCYDGNRWRWCRSDYNRRRRGSDCYDFRAANHHPAGFNGASGH